MWLFFLFEIAVPAIEWEKNTENSTHLVICKLDLTTGTITTYQRERANECALLRWSAKIYISNVYKYFDFYPTKRLFPSLLSSHIEEFTVDGTNKQTDYLLRMDWTEPQYYFVSTIALAVAQMPKKHWLFALVMEQTRYDQNVDYWTVPRKCYDFIIFFFSFTHRPFFGKQ